MLTAVAPVQAEKGDDDARPWGVDVLQAYMDKQLSKECALGLPDSPQVFSIACTECCCCKTMTATAFLSSAFCCGCEAPNFCMFLWMQTCTPCNWHAEFIEVRLRMTFCMCASSPKDDEQGSGGKIIAGMPNSPTNGSHGTNGTSETEGLISGRKASR